MRALAVPHPVGAVHSSMAAVPIESDNSDVLAFKELLRAHSSVCSAKTRDGGLGGNSPVLLSAHLTSRQLLKTFACFSPVF